MSSDEREITFHNGFPPQVGDAASIKIDGKVINGQVTYVERDPWKEFTVRCTFTGVPIIFNGVASEGTGE